MADTIAQTEDRPEVLPYHVQDYARPDAWLIWERIEAYISYRWTPRQVVWIVEGSGDWRPPLTPAEITAAEVWTGAAWQPATLPPSPYGGLCLPGNGPFRVTATVGGGSTPAAALEAYARLEKYLSAVQRTPGERFAYRQMARNRYDAPPVQQTPAQDRVRVAEIDGSVEYVANWPARAMQLSGAADLLRPYRRA